MPGLTVADRDRPSLPLTGLRVLEYAQYVAGPFAALLLADLGADVIKVEPPAGDAWRRYEPFAEGQSRYFYALNRNKRSVVLDLKTEDGRRQSEHLITGSNAVIHNFPLDRATAYGLDREHVRKLNPSAVWCSVSALGSDGPQAHQKAFDLVAQALSGLLLADVHLGDRVPHRAGGVAMADFTAGLLAAVAVLAGLVGASRATSPAPGVEVSLLGAALAVQTQRLVSVEAIDAGRRAERLAGAPLATPEDLAANAERMMRNDELEPYYRAYAAADGFFVLACLNERQRRAALAVTGLTDDFITNPQAPPIDEQERAVRLAHTRRLERLFAARPANEWIAALREAGAPAAEVRVLDHLYDDPQVAANGLIESLELAGAGTIRQLGSVFKVNGRAGRSLRPPPLLGEHTSEILGHRRESAV